MLRKQNRFSAHIVHVAHKPLKPTLIEVYGTGSIVEAANGALRNLNIDGLDAFDLRTEKANGQPWDFSRRQNRMEAVKYIKEREPTWVIGTPPCTPFSQLQGLNFRKMPR